MFEFLASFTALPNLHPALVHFPIALVFVALFVEGGFVFLRRQVWLERAAAMLYVFATVSAGVAYFSGRRAADTVQGIPADAEWVLSLHSDFALWTLVVLVIATSLRVTSSVGSGYRPAARFGWLRSAGILTLLIAAGLVSCTADLGGLLVYRHGLAVAKVGSVANSAQATQNDVIELTPIETVEEPILGADGTLEWRPSSSGTSPLGAVLQAAPNGALGAVRVADLPSDGVALRLEVSGRTVLCLPREFGDVVVEAVFDITDFEGTVGLGHHIRSIDEGVFFTLDSSRRAVLFREEGGSKREFDSAPVADNPKRTILSTSVAGSHLKGQVNGQVVVHGHGSSGDDGQVGILINGRGEIGIERITVTPLSHG